MPKLAWSSKRYGKRGYGDRPSSLCFAYERGDSPGRIYLERCWIDGTGRSSALKHGTTRRAAENLAQRVAVAREEALLQGRDQFGEVKGGITFFGLLKAYHDPTQNRKVRKWSDKHAQEQERCRKFWREEIKDVPLPGGVSKARVEAIAGNATEARGWSPRTEQKYLKYVKGVFAWGHERAAMYRENPLAGLYMPAPDPNTSELLYTPAQASKLITPTDGVDWRVTLACSIAVDTGRRLGSIVHLWAGTDADAENQDIALTTLHGLDPDTGEPVEWEVMVLCFRKEHDKGSKNDTWIPVSEHTRALVEAAVKRPKVAYSGWLLPGGHLARKKDSKNPVREDSMTSMLEGAEKTLGIEHVPYRGYHGLKRIHVTISDELSGGDTGLVGDLTGNKDRKLLQNVYRFAQFVRMARHVEDVRRRFQENPSDQVGLVGAEMRRVGR